MKRLTRFRVACAALSLSLAGCEEAPEITVGAACTVGEWRALFDHDAPAQAAARKESRALRCVPVEAISSEGTLRCVGLLRVPVDELPDGCESLGLEPWWAGAGVDTEVCVLPWAFGDAEPPTYGFVFDTNDECVDRGDTPYAARLSPLPFDLPGQAELRCRISEDPACPSE